MAQEHPVLKANPTLQDVQAYIGEVIEHRGFDKQSVQDELLLLSEEIGELVKAVRQHTGNVRNDAGSQGHKIEHEAADVLWMLVCVCNRLGIDLEAALRAKEEHNKTRTWR